MVWRAIMSFSQLSVLVLSLAYGELGEAANACNQRAVAFLKKHSASGYNSYVITRDKNTFNSFSADCRNWDDFVDSDINTAVHETNHVIRGEQNAYHLVSNEMLPVPPAPNYFAPAVLVPILAANPQIKSDTYFQTYLSNSGEGSNGSREEFTYLLDELNAYSNGMQTQIDFSGIHAITNRDGGVPALMTFVAAYATYAQQRHPSVWRDLTSSPASTTRLAVGKLWSQAETVLRRACELAPTSVGDDSAYIESLCADSQTRAISAVVGRQVRCPSECARPFDSASGERPER